MKKYEFYDALEAAIPEASPAFGRAVRKTLRHIARDEATHRTPQTSLRKPVLGKRRALVIVLATVLVLAIAAAAATLLRRNVFEVTMGDTPENAAALTRYDLVQETIGDAEIIVREAAYDGMALYIVYSIRDLTATAPFGEVDEDGVNYLRQEDYEQIADLGVGWWNDNLWIDGKRVGMPNMSGGADLPGEQNGEILYYMMYRLDQENIFLDGTNVEIALPIGERQPPESLVITEEPFDIAKPDKGMVTFHLDCSSRAQVRAEPPKILMEGPRWSARVSQVIYSPIQMYVTLDWEIKPEVLEAYIEENGDGYYEGDVMLWPYDALEVCGGEIMSLQLVDREGNPVFETMEGFYGCGGAGATQAWFTFPYTEKYPEAMFLAPEVDGAPDMTQAIQVK